MSYLNDELRETLQSLKRAFDDGTLVEREYEEERAHVLKRARQAYDSRPSSSSASASRRAPMPTCTASVVDNYDSPEIFRNDACILSKSCRHLPTCHDFCACFMWGCTWLYVSSRVLLHYCACPLTQAAT